VPTEDEIQRIIALHEDGKSQREIAKEFDKSVGWVNGILKKLNVSSERSQTKKATEAKRTYDRERRLALNDLWFEKIEKMLLEAEDSRTLRELATPYGVAMDKRSILEPMQSDTAKTGLEEMREAIHKARQNGMETSAANEQSG
jgi:transposase